MRARDGDLPLKPLSAEEELLVLHRAPMLLPALLRRGLSPQDAMALAHNATLLYYAMGSREGELASPRAVLERLSLREIAEQCQRLAALQEEGEQ